MRPVTIASRLVPYLRYYDSGRHIDDHGAMPSVLVVFKEELAAGHFLRVARREMGRAGMEVPFRVSHRSAQQGVGPLGPAWRSTDTVQQAHAVG